jgi:ribose 5-phosphate isomerase B
MQEVKRIAVGSDHAAAPVLSSLVQHLRDRGWDVTDFTVIVDGRADYPVAGRKVAEAVAGGGFPRGLLLCGTGLGMSYVANRVKGVRAALCMTVEFARLAREHNDANILVMPGRVDSVDPREAILDAWLDTPFSGDERHKKRIAMIDNPDLA